MTKIVLLRSLYCRVRLLLHLLLLLLLPSVTELYVLLVMLRSSLRWPVLFCTVAAAAAALVLLGAGGGGCCSSGYSHCLRLRPSHCHLYLRLWPCPSISRPIWPALYLRRAACAVSCQPTIKRWRVLPARWRR